MQKVRYNNLANHFQPPRYPPPPPPLPPPKHTPISNSIVLCCTVHRFCCVATFERHLVLVRSLSIANYRKTLIQNKAANFGAAVGSQHSEASTPKMSGSVPQHEGSSSPVKTDGSVASTQAIEAAYGSSFANSAMTNGIRPSETSKLNELYASQFSDGYSAGVGKGLAGAATGSFRAPANTGGTGTQLSTILDSTSDNVRPYPPPPFLPDSCIIL